MFTTPEPESTNLKAELNLGYICLISSVAALGGLLFGWDWVVIGGAPGNQFHTGNERNPAGAFW